MLALTFCKKNLFSPIVPGVFSKLAAFWLKALFRSPLFNPSRCSRQQMARAKPYSRRLLGALSFCFGLLSCQAYRGEPIYPLSTSLHRVVRCLDPDKGPVEIEADRDLIVLVHGCNSSVAKFKNLAEVFRSRGQQAVCFTYDDRDSLISAADELTTALSTVAPQLGSGRITVIGHSQGGLIARRAVTQVDQSPAQVEQLVTISSPFAGIRSARDCGLMPLHIFTFGITVGICQMIAGRKWTEIHSRAPFVTSPPPLASEVERHLAVVTDERDSCRRYEGSHCSASDFVFSLEEQSTKYVKDPRVEERVVRAGHTRIVGETEDVPYELLGLLEEQAVLRPTSQAPNIDHESFLRQLYQKNRDALASRSR